MSTRSVDRSAVAHKKDRTAAAHQNRRSASASRNDRSAALQKDRSSLCTFTFAEGRCCRPPRCSSGSSYCFFHARKEAQARAADQLGRDISYFLSGEYVAACDLSVATIYAPKLSLRRPAPIGNSLPLTPLQSTLTKAYENKQLKVL